MNRNKHRPTLNVRQARRRALWLAFSALMSPWAVSAAVLPETQAEAVRRVVSGQLKALAAGDADRAYAYATAAIQAQFGNARNFMAMVQGSYGMLIRPSGVSFFQAQRLDGAVTQVVQVRDLSGRLWRATYTLEAQPDLAWRIGGCSVAPDDGKSST